MLSFLIFSAHEVFEVEGREAAKGEAEAAAEEEEAAAVAPTSEEWLPGWELKYIFFSSSGKRKYSHHSHHDINDTTWTTWTKQALGHYEHQYEHRADSKDN